jgi:hypothetical protein
MGIRDRLARLASVARAQDPASGEFGDLRRAPDVPGVVMRVPRPSRSFEIACPRISPSWPSALRPAWWIAVVWSARTPVSYGSTGSSGQQPDSGAGVRGRHTAAGPGGGAGVVGVASAPVFSAVEPMAAHTTDSAELSKRRIDTGHNARPPALITALPGPDREIVESRTVAGVSIPDIVAILGLTPGVFGLAQHQALGALRPTATAHGPHQPASGWCCCHTPRPSPLTPRPHHHRAEGDQP